MTANKKWSLLVLCGAAMLGGILFSKNAMADYYGEGNGDGGIIGCETGALCTKWGAVWRQYQWDDVAAGVYYPLMYIDDNGDVHVTGRDEAGGNGNYDYAKHGTIDKKCNDEGLGSFYRYAMVAEKDFNYGGNANVKKGDQLGLVGINGNALSIYNSQFFGGGMNYYASAGKPWAEVRDYYKELQQQWADDNYFPLSWENDNLAWFCAPKDRNATYSSQSNVANDKIGGYSTTGVNSGALKTVYTANARVKVGDTVKLTFSHNIYATSSSNNVRWSMTKDGSLNGGSGYTISQVTGSGLTTATSGQANLTVLTNGLYTAETRSGNDGTNEFLVREQYDVTFNQANNSGYTFCEMIGVYGNNGVLSNYTKVCTRVIVGDGDGGGPGDDGTPQQLCTAWTPSSYMSSGAYIGTTSVTVRVRNTRLTGTYSGWRGENDEGTDPQRNVALDSRITYAKPGDTVRWADCYWPGVQTVSETMRSSYHGAEGMYIDGTANGNKATYTFGTWENRYSVESTTNSSSTFSGASPSSGSFSRGDSYMRAGGNTQTINTLNDVGKYFQETIASGIPVYVNMTNEGRHNWDCFPFPCCKCSCPGEGCCGCPGTCYNTCHHSEDYVRLNTWTNGPVKSGEARVEVPYNFVNETSVSVSLPTLNYNSQDAVYAGEKIRVYNPKLTIGTKYNSLTEDTYATVVDSGHVQLVAYVASGTGAGVRTIPNQTGDEKVCDIIYDDLPGYCQVVRQVDSRLNSGGDLNGATYTNSIEGVTFNGDEYNVFDAPAGSYMCFALAVYPWTSGEDNNLEQSGDKTWYVSAPACKIIAKKPSMQILGGSLFSGGSVYTNTSEKSVVNGIYNYPADGVGSNNRTIFGSFAEQSVVANGIVTGFASGAATGTNTSRFGGSHEGGTVNFCKNRTPLSFANVGSIVIGELICSASGTGNFEATGQLGVTLPTTNRAAIADYFVAGAKIEGAGGGDNFGSYEMIQSATGKEIKVTNVDLATSGGTVYNIYGMDIAPNNTRVVKVTGGSVTINGDIKYLASNWYDMKTNATSMREVPKVIIYASENISVSCGVSRIDAILIAGQTVSTCNGYSSTNVSTWNASDRTNGLTINGMVIANKIDPGRTYGNGTGENSIVPAETINYDTSAILWGRSMADAGESDTLTTVYQHELAPRY